jgi:hypothetical protein
MAEFLEANTSSSKWSSPLVMAFQAAKDPS